MSLDELARAATVELHRSATAGLDPDDMLRRMHRARLRRTRALAAAAVVVLAVGSAVALVAGAAGDGVRPAPPAHSDRPSVDHRDCGRGTTCLGGRRLRVDLKRPIEVTVPARFALLADVYGPTGVSFYRADRDASGVSLLADAVPVRYAPGWLADRSAGTTAQEMATWLAGRPFLRDTRVERRTVDGVDAWAVLGELRPGAALPARRDGKPFAPAFRSGSFMTGWSDTVRAAYTLVDQPGGGVSALWSFSWGETHPDLPGNQPAVDALVVAVGRS